MPPFDDAHLLRHRSVPRFEANRLPQEFLDNIIYEFKMLFVSDIGVNGNERGNGMVSGNFDGINEDFAVMTDSELGSKPIQ